jgi:hypothetical protein
MGMMDDMQGGMNMDAMRARYNELRNMEQDGKLDDDGRMELDRLRSQFE